MSPLLRVALASLLFLTGVSTGGRAAPPRLSETFDEAARRWFEDAGLAALGGYGRYTEDRDEAGALLKRIDGGRLRLVPIRVGERFGIGVEADLTADPASTGVCTRGAIITAMNAWRYLASREVSNVPVSARLRCRFIEVVATFRDPARPRPDGGLDLLSVVQKVPESGAVHLEWHEAFTLPPRSVKAEAGPKGLDLLYGLVADGRYRDAAKVLGDRVEPVESVELQALVTGSSPVFFVDPALHPGVDLVGGTHFATETPSLCLSASVLAFVRSVTEHARLGLGVDGKLRYRVEDTCNHGGRVQILREGPAEARVSVAWGDGSELTEVGVIPVGFAPIDVAGTRHRDWYEAAIEAQTKPSPKNAAGRLAWLEARLATVARLAGATDAEIDALDGFGLELVARGTVEALGTGKARIRCEPAIKGAARACSAEPPVDLPQASCAAVAWALAAGLPHLPKAPFGAKDEVRLEILCGTELGEGLSVVAHRRLAAGSVYLDIIASGRAERRATEEECLDFGFDIECGEVSGPLSAVRPKRLALAAPIDPAALKPVKVKRPTPPRAGGGARR